MAIDAATILVPLLSSLGGGAIVALVNHWLTASRERTKRLDELTIQRRIEAYKRLEKGSQTGRDTNLSIDDLAKIFSEFESAYSETILLGTKKEIDLAQDMAKRLIFENDSAGLLALLDELRNNLRKDLNLEYTTLGETRFFRFNRP